MTSMTHVGTTAPSGRRVRRLGLLGLLLAMMSTIVPTIASPSPARAADTFAFFEASPGFFRTQLRAAAMDFDPTSGILYTTVVDDAGTSVIAVDPVSFAIVDQVVVDTEELVVTDMDVSRSGTTVLVAAADRIIRLSRADLVVEQVTSLYVGIGPPNRTRRVVAAPDRDDRFLTYDNIGPIQVVTGTNISEVRLPIGGLSRAVPGPASWGETSEFVYARDGSQLVELTLDEPAAVVRELTFPTLGAPPIVFHDGALLVDRTLVDLATFTIRDAAPVPSSNVLMTSRDATGVAFRNDGGWQSFDTTDLSAPTVTWEFPGVPRILDVVSLGGSQLAARESSSDGRTSYLVFADTSVLTSPAGEFHPVSPTRLLDTRNGTGRETPGRLVAGENVSVQIAGAAGIPANGVLAVVLNATVANPTERGFFTLWPGGVDRPGVSNLNFAAGDVLANFVTVPVGVDGTVALANDLGSAHAILDVVGYYSSEDGVAGARYTPRLSPTRLLDTRLPNAASARLGPGQTIELAVPGTGPGTMVAAALNVTAVNPSQGGFLSIFPGNEARPTASNLNFGTGGTRANLVLSAVSPTGTVKIYNESGSVDIVVDLSGVYARSAAPRRDQQGRFLAITPYRDFDSRVDSPFDPPGAVEPGSALILSNSAGWTDIINVTAVRPTSNGYLSVIGWDPVNPPPFPPQTSTVNFRANETVANAAYAPGTPLTAIANPFGSTHVVVDRFGYLTPDTHRPPEEIWGQ